MRTIYSIGHSSHPITAFISMLQAHNIRHLADIRSFPGSRRYPQYNQQALAAMLAGAGIQYSHHPGLGGRRGFLPQGTDAAEAQDQHYSSHMKTVAFHIAIQKLETIAGHASTTFMCAEADWRHCHRAFVSGYLHRNGWQVVHIRSAESTLLHPVTSQCSLF